MAEYIVRGVPKSLLRDGWWLVEKQADFGADKRNPLELSSKVVLAKKYAVSDAAS